MACIVLLPGLLWVRAGSRLQKGLMVWPSTQRKLTRPQRKKGVGCEGLTELLQTCWGLTWAYLPGSTNKEPRRIFSKLRATHQKDIYTHRGSKCHQFHIEKLRKYTKKTKKYQHIPKNTKKYPKIPKSTQKYQNIPCYDMGLWIVNE